MTAPDVATHYHAPHRRPFLNLSDLGERELAAVLAELGAERAAGTNKRVFGRVYMDLRREAEERMRDLFVAAGGTVERSAPHYFVLGNSEWFQGLHTDMAEVVIALADLPEATTSITWCDSFAAMAVGKEYGVQAAPEPIRHRVFRLSELPELLARWGLPEARGPAYDAYERELIAHFVEIQVWSDDPRPPLALTSSPRRTGGWVGGRGRVSHP